MFRLMFRRAVSLSLFCAFFLISSIAFARHSGSSTRVRLIPNFAVGQTFRYAVQMRTATTTIATGPITDAGGPKILNQDIGVVIRLDVLSAANVIGSPSSARIRATYEKAAASGNSAAYDPDVAAMEDEYKKLAGQSIEFTLESDGKITDVTGLQNLASDSDPTRAATLNQWLSQLTLGASLPKQGIAVGEKWSSEQPLSNLPLAGLAWKTTATYVRNEPCPAATQSPADSTPITPAASPDKCAVIMTHSEIVGGSGSNSKDRTPDVFRQNGLRTSGVWTGTAESLTSISLRTGMVASVTQTGSTHMDFTIMTTLQRNRMRYAGDTHSQSEITLLPQSAVP
ncbi:MAG TPA: hypothetical protein VKB26_07795 [Candidatus Acidoferrales bacterium]|nr:hypothetical protein [Candidatus Acidoferrales bacterium]